jgi:hypothetical protein
MTIYCHKCGCYLGEIVGRIKRGTEYLCSECANPEMPEFLKQIFGDKKL